MSGKFLQPDESAVLGVMKMLYGDGSSVAGGAAQPHDGALCGVYVSDDDTPVALAVCDSAFGAYAGAALSMIPAGGAQDAAASGDLSVSMMENLQEVMNICSNLFMNDSTPHLRLGAVHRCADTLCGESKALFEKGQGPSFTIEIPRYGSGVLTLLS